MAENALYELACIPDNPLYEGFAFVREESLRGGLRLDMDFGPGVITGRAWTVPPLAPIWTPQPVVGQVRPLNDYPCVNLSVPAFSLRAIDALRDFLEPNGELLPLVSSVGEYYAYNITTVADILDRARSEIQWSKQKPDIAIMIMRYECFADRMAGLSIFRIVERSSGPFVSQPFVDRVREHGLRGLRFIKLWPLPDGVNWQDVDRAEYDKELLVATPAGPAPAKGNTVVLMLASAKAKPSKAEKARLAKVMDEIDALLYDPAPDAPLLGSLEGDEHGRGEFRLFLSCPNADALVEKLRPWLKTLAWEGGIRVLKRYGVYTDPDCREEYAEL